MDAQQPASPSVEAVATPPPPRKHGRLYWLCVNFVRGIRVWFAAHKLRSTLIAAALLFVLFMLRAFVHHWVIGLRVYSFEIVCAAAALYAIGKLSHRMGWKSWSAVVVIALFIAAGFVASWTPHDYMSLYLRYRSLDKKDIAVLPETDHERIQPLNSIRVLVKEVMTDNRQPSEPFNVRIGDEFRWTMGVEPSFFWSRLEGSVSEVINVSATAPSPNFSAENRDAVDFPIGENLLLGKNTEICTVRSFGLFRFLSYEPVDVKYLKDDTGQWVEVVSLLKYQGVLFPQPVFGGVQVIHQSKGGFFHYLRVWMLGDGDWIPPSAIAKYEYLRGQNLVPYEVSRFAAQSFRFHRGLLAPFWGYHQGDVRIPEMPEDVNEQPYTTYFKFDDGTGKLFHYFSLEPYQPDKQGASLSLLFPADGIGPVYVHDHDLYHETLIGVSAVTGKIKESRKMYDWTHSRPAEHRPYIRTIAGQRRFFWLSTIVTYKGNETTKGSDFVAGAIPDIVLTDPISRVSVWVDSRNPAGWPDQLEKELSGIWSQK